ncbi:MAG: hypothetical protein HYZ29_24260 [Myxococcales bacterium]|nr:hypothetical protein [Myxococcales bacterium]
MRNAVLTLLFLTSILIAGCKRGDVRRAGPDSGFAQTPCRTEYKAGNFGSAASACELQMNAPGQHAARAFAALARLQLGEYPKAEEIARTGAAVTSGKTGALFLSLQGLVVVAAGDPARAQELMDAAVRLAQDSAPDVYLSRAKARFVAGALGGALEDAKRAQSIDRASAAPELMLGYLLLREGSSGRKDASTHFARALSLQAANPRAVVCRYVTTSESGEVPAPKDTSWDQRLLELPRRGPAAKDDLLEWAAATDGRHAAAERRVEVHVLLGVLAETQGVLTRARTEYRTALSAPVHSMDSVLARTRLRALGAT